MHAWVSSLSLGVEAIDRQHEEFFALCCGLESLVRRRAPAERLRGAVNALARHSLEHFALEERWLVDTGYAQREPEAFQFHVEQHDLLKGRLDHLDQAIAAGTASPALVLAANLEMYDHMLRHDLSVKVLAGACDLR